jgi:hypothetical protein
MFQSPGLARTQARTRSARNFLKIQADLRDWQDAWTLAIHGLDLLSKYNQKHMSNKPFDPTKPVQTRDGRKARIVDDKYSSRGGNLVAITTLVSGAEDVRVYFNDGRYTRRDELNVDLINIPVKHTVWLNIYDTTSLMADHTIGHHETRASADCNAFPNRIACVPVTYIEGEGL